MSDKLQAITSEFDSKVRVSDVHEHDDSCDHDHPVGVIQGQAGDDVDVTMAIRPKNERKARKALAKLGLKRIMGIHRVTICRMKNIVFAITNPEVYHIPHSNSYVVFGEPKVEEMPGMNPSANAMAQAQAAARKLKTESIEDLESALLQDVSTSVPKEENDDQDLDESDLQENDIAMIMEQAGVSRRKAVKTLLENDGDIVNAIMALN